MGGLVGGLYSIGYSPDFLDSLVRTVDWDLALSDKVPQELIAYRQKKYKEKYFASVPFYYDVKDLFNRDPGEILRASERGLHFGAGDESGGAARRRPPHNRLPVRRGGTDESIWSSIC